VNDAELLDVEFAEERHGDGPAHLNATFGDLAGMPGTAQITDRSGNEIGLYQG